MKIVFVSNYYNHHQASFAKEMDIQTQHSFVFIETEAMSEERKKMGWKDDDKPSYVRQSFGSRQEYRECQKLIDEADAVIWGSCPFEMIRGRLKEKRLTFCYSERLFKKGFGPIAFGGRAIKYFMRHCRYQKNHYLLCASAYAADDYAKIGLFRNRAYKWGYFPEFFKVPDVEALISAKDPLCMLWAGRMIDWKHPELPVQLAKRLRDEGIRFRLDMIGSGDCEEEIKQLIDRYDLKECVKLHGAMSPKEVRERMDKAAVYLFTSDHNEGWGAVLNEAMNSACAVIANREIGAVPYLLQSGVNGLIYDNEEELYEMAKNMLFNRAKSKKFGLRAYETIRTQWCAEIAAQRLCQFIMKIQCGEVSMWDMGPCSKSR